MRQIALITGANRGLGLAIVGKLGIAGVAPIVGARDPGGGQRAVDQLRRQGVDAESVELDITDSASVTAARDEIDARHGRIDILANNAGVLPEAAAGSLVVPLQMKMFRSTFETNVLGTVAVIETMLPLLRNSTAGRIVNVSSSLGSLDLQTDPVWPSSTRTKTGRRRH